MHSDKLRTRVMSLGKQYHVKVVFSFHSKSFYFLSAFFFFIIDVSMFSESLPMSGPEESFITELRPVEGPVCLQMLMSHVVSPSEFYVHLVAPDAGILDVMMDELNKFYGST